MDQEEFRRLVSSIKVGDCFRVIPQGEITRLPVMPNVGYVFSRNEWIKTAEIDTARRVDPILFLEKNDLVHYHGSVETFGGQFLVFSRSSNSAESFFLAPNLFQHLKFVPMVQSQKRMMMKRRLR